MKDLDKVVYVREMTELQKKYLNIPAGGIASTSSLGHELSHVEQQPKQRVVHKITSTLSI